MPNQDQHWMQQALFLAERAAVLDEVPVGALVVLDDEIIAEGWNQPISGCDPTAHAEIIALRAASKKVGNYRLLGASLYVTLEPCSMCAGAMVHARINRLVYAASEPKSGAISHNDFFVQPWLNHKVDVTAGVLAEPASAQLRQFFKRKRA